MTNIVSFLGGALIAFLLTCSIIQDELTLLKTNANICIAANMTVAECVAAKGERK